MNNKVYDIVTSKKAGHLLIGIVTCSLLLPFLKVISFNIASIIIFTMNIFINIRAGLIDNKNSVKGKYLYYFLSLFSFAMVVFLVFKTVIFV